jgi:hypothetical protein
MVTVIAGEVTVDPGRVTVLPAEVVVVVAFEAQAATMGTSMIIAKKRHDFRNMFPSFFKRLSYSNLQTHKIKQKYIKYL